MSTGVPADVVPPKFTQLLKDIESNEGERVIFECRVIGHPTPAIKWYRGRQEIQHSADFQVSHSRADSSSFSSASFIVSPLSVAFHKWQSDLIHLTL